MKIITSLFFITLLSVSLHAHATLPEAQLKELTHQFIAAKNARQQPNSSAKDVDHLLSFLADEFVDEHVKFNVTVNSKADLRAGMLAKLNDKIIFSNIEIMDIMFGRNVAFVKFKEHAKGQPAHLDKPVEYTAINVMSLEFNDDGKIKHIRRHHGL